jgi:hypothetical protein
MSSEKLGHNNNVLKGDLGGGFNILTGSTGEQTDLGIARRFGGSAAAYSLRDIGAMNGPVVKVRREPHDTTSAVDDEENFSAHQVQSGALEDWVNGKLENTLPADVDTAAAAYSLRKVRAGYAEDAVRIRRSSDSIEVDVGFDSDDKVSASSAITNVAEQGGEIGQTTATTLGGFLNESNVNVGMGNTFFDQNDQVDITGASATGFTATVAKNNTNDIDIRAGGQAYDNVKKGTVTISYNVVQNTLSNAFTVQLWQLVSGEGYKIVDTVPSGTTGSRSVTFENTDTDGAIFRFVTEDHLVNDGEVLQISDLSITASKHTATVHTWYDQVGSNDITQTTAANQPNIAESGALLVDGVDFDGSASYLDATSALGATATVGAFIVHKPDDTDENQYLIDNRDGTGDGMRIMQRSDADGNYRFSMDSTDVNSASGSVTTNETLLTAIQSSTAATLFKNSAQQATAADDAISVTAAFRIGANRVSTGTYFDGTMKEIILFTSDQTDNRFKIESNINNYYGLYTFQGDGFVHTWFDQSGNGNDAVQGTAANQPAIVTSGSLNDGLTFDGTNDFLQTSTQVLTGTNTGSNGIYAVVNVTSGDAGYVAGSASDGTGVGQSIYASSSSSKFILTEGLDADASERDTIAITVGSFVLISACYNNNDANTLQKNSSTTGYTNGTDPYTFTAGTKFTIGHRDRDAGVNAATNLTGTIKEVIAFDIDTTSDRSEIQADIQNHYNL